MNRGTVPQPLVRARGTPAAEHCIAHGRRSARWLHRDPRTRPGIPYEADTWTRYGHQAGASLDIRFRLPPWQPAGKKHQPAGSRRLRGWASWTALTRMAEIVTGAPRHRPRRHPPSPCASGMSPRLRAGRLIWPSHSITSCPCRPIPPRPPAMSRFRGKGRASRMFEFVARLDIWARGAQPQPGAAPCARRRPRRCLGLCSRRAEPASAPVRPGM